MTPTGLLLSRDLIFTSKITGTARMLGHHVATAGGVALATQMLGDGEFRAVFVDLAAGDLVAPSAIENYKKIAPETAFLAFGSHVDPDTLHAARDAGCTEVMPRSRFTTELSTLIRRYLGEGTGVAG